MESDTFSPRDIDEYISGFPPDIRVILEKIRVTIKSAAPDAVETIKYQMPAFTFHGNLVYFSAFKKHIGFYPPVHGDGQLKRELAKYEGPKKSLKFPLDQPIPYGLIARIVKLRMNENLEKEKTKRSKNYT